MNPCEIEIGTATYIGTSVEAIPAAQVYPAVNSEQLDPEKQAVVVRADGIEFRSTTCFVATVEVAVRTPATVFTQADHSELLGEVVAALSDQADFITGFNAAATGVDLLGSTPVNFRAPSFEDRAWVNVISVGIGVVTS